MFVHRLVVRDTVEDRYAPRNDRRVPLLIVLLKVCFVCKRRRRV